MPTLMESVAELRKLIAEKLERPVDKVRVVRLAPDAALALGAENNQVIAGVRVVVDGALPPGGVTGG